MRDKNLNLNRNLLAGWGVGVKVCMHKGGGQAKCIELHTTRFLCVCTMWMTLRGAFGSRKGKWKM